MENLSKAEQMKKNNSIKIVILTFLIIANSSFGSEYKAGTYLGNASGYKDQIQVEVKISSDKIEDIKVVKHKESPRVSDIALSRIPQEIIKYQSLAVDSVAGATSTSRGVKGAIVNALKSAGVDIKKLQAKKIPAIVKETKEYESDVVIIGAGGAGLAAAVSAHQNGANVIIIEKMPHLGGNTLISGSAYNAVDSKRQALQGIEDSIDLHFKHTYEGGDKAGDTKLIKILVENAYPAIEWLESLGMEFTSNVFTVLGALHPRSHKPVKPIGTGYIDTYDNYIKNNKGITVLTEAKADDFIVENGKIVGVKTIGRTEDAVIRANRGVILATGGYGADIEVRQQYVPKLTDMIPTTNHPGATAEGLKLAEKYGANLLGLENIQLLPSGDPITGSLSGSIGNRVEERIYVNKLGKRFVAEDARRDVMTNALFEQKDAFMWVVMDSTACPQGENTKNNFNETLSELLAQGRAFKGDTVEELAKKIGLDPIVLQETLDEYNKSVDTKNDKFGKKLFGNRIEKGPFYAGGRVPTVHHTMGGVQINEKTQVLDKDGKIISGLYAAGEVTGGIHGANRLGGNALADITVFGRIAGEEAAKNK